VSSDGFDTTVHPAAIAGDAFLVSIAIGKFHYKTTHRHAVQLTHLEQSAACTTDIKPMTDKW